jgi:hypothetical protein
MPVLVQPDHLGTQRNRGEQCRGQPGTDIRFAIGAATVRKRGPRRAPIRTAGVQVLEEIGAVPVLRTGNPDAASLGVRISGTGQEGL